tara:strand:- start:496 stop:1374 length:879 start_codon:yes stop_codon:yes gene_type:complete
MKMKWLTLGTSLTLAATAAYFSIVGLMTIFSGAVVGIAIMATVLEIGKLVSAAWLHYEWDRINNLVRGYFTAAVIVLMLITSMGIFGFLSKAHIDSALVSDTYSLEASIIDTRIAAEQSKLKAAQDRIEGLDYVLQTSQPKDRNYVNGRQTEERNNLAITIDQAVDSIVQYTEQKLPIQRLQLEQESELGPVKYIADMIYGSNAKEYYDNAVRWIILIIIFVFDPLAIMLLIVSTAAFKRDRETPAKPLVDNSQVMNMEIKEKESGLSVEIKENASGLVKTGLTTTLKRRKI